MASRLKILDLTREYNEHQNRSADKKLQDVKGLLSNLLTFNTEQLNAINGKIESLKSSGRVEQLESAKFLIGDDNDNCTTISYLLSKEIEATRRKEWNDSSNQTYSPSPTSTLTLTGSQILRAKQTKSTGRLRDMDLGGLIRQREMLHISINHMKRQSSQLHHEVQTLETEYERRANMHPAPHAIHPVHLLAPSEIAEYLRQDTSGQESILKLIVSSIPGVMLSPELGLVLESGKTCARFKFPLLSLPPEIRNYVYELVLTTSPCGNSPAITEVCRQIRSETLPMHYAINTFRVNACKLKDWFRHHEKASPTAPYPQKVLIQLSELRRFGCETTFEITPIIDNLDQLASGVPLAKDPSRLISSHLIRKDANHQKRLKVKFSIRIGIKDLTNEIEFWKIIHSSRLCDRGFVKAIAVSEDGCFSTDASGVYFDMTHPCIRDACSSQVAKDKAIRELWQHGLRRSHFRDALHLDRDRAAGRYLDGA